MREGSLTNGRIYRKGKRTHRKSLYVFLSLAVIVIIGMLPGKGTKANEANDTYVEINQGNFPDSVFRNYVSENFDAVKDGKLSSSEIEAATNIELYDAGCSSLEGIGFLTAVEYIDCSGNMLTSLNLSSCKELTELDCSGNQLTSLNLNNCTNLEDLYCSENMLTGLNLNACTGLINLDCYDNNLTSLLIDNCTELTDLDCSDNQLTSLNLINNTKLNSVYADDNNIGALNIFNCSNLKSAYAAKPAGTGKYFKNSGTKDENGDIIYYILYFDPTTTIITQSIPLTIDQQPSDIEGVLGNTVVFSISASGTGLKYQWQTSKDGGISWVDSHMPGYNTGSLSVSVIPDRNGYKFRCAVTDTYGQKVISDMATLSVKTEVTISSQPADITATVGTDVNFKITASGTGLKYQWQTSKDGGTTWVNSGMSGYNTNTLTVKAVVDRNGYRFRCVVTDIVGKQVISDSAVLKIKSEVELKITSQPQDVTAAPGTTTTFSVTASGSGLKYQWQTSKDGGTTWVNSGMSGYNTNVLTVGVNVDRNGYKFRCIVTDNVGNKVTSSAATLYLKSETELKITSQPQDVTAAPGTTVTFSITAEGSGLKYQWQTSKDGGTTWVNSGMQGYKTNVLTVLANIDRNGYKFRCVVTDSVGNKVTSSAGALKIQSETELKITSHPSDVTTVSGTTVTFSVTVSGSGLKYQWQTSKDGGTTWVNSGMPGYNTNILSVSANKDRNGYRFRCVITDSVGNKVTSNAASLTVNK